MKPYFLLIALTSVGCGEDNSAEAPHAPTGLTVPSPSPGGTTIEEDCKNYCKEMDEFKACLQNPFGMCSPPSKPFFCGDCK